jgi:hypothetical protein
LWWNGFTAEFVWELVAATTKVGEGGVVQNASGGIADVQQNLKQRAVLGVFFNAAAKRLGVFKGRERTVDPADYITKKDFRGCAIELISTVGAANAGDDASAFQVQENVLEKLLRQILFGGDVLNASDAGGMLARKDGKRLQSIESAMGDSHKLD